MGSSRHEVTNETKHHEPSHPHKANQLDAWLPNEACSEHSAADIPPPFSKRLHTPQNMPGGETTPTAISRSRKKAQIKCKQKTRNSIYLHISKDSTNYTEVFSKWRVHTYAPKRKTRKGSTKHPVSHKLLFFSETEALPHPNIPTLPVHRSNPPTPQFFTCCLRACLFPPAPLRSNPGHNRQANASSIKRLLDKAETLLVRFRLPTLCHSLEAPFFRHARLDRRSPCAQAQIWRPLLPPWKGPWNVQRNVSRQPRRPDPPT